MVVKCSEPGDEEVHLLTTPANERADLDSPWKEILRAYFPQAIQFFFPATAALVDWAKPVEFLDTQLRQITKEAEVGRRVLWAARRV
jgi:hypothetical protein